MKAGIYCRVSTLEQAEQGYSLIAQQEKLEAYAKGMGYSIFNVYVDDGYSGKSLTRPAITKLIEDVKNYKVNIVLIYKLDRLSRKVKDVLELVELFEKYNVSLFSLTENLDLSSPFGRAALKMSATFSELERETIVERMKMGKLQRAKSGRAMRTSTLPIGYDYDTQNERFVPNPVEKEQVEKIYELYLKGWNFANLSAYMHKNYKNRYGSYNNRTAVAKVIDNPFSCGYYWYNGELYKATNIEPIISYETWLKAECMRLNAKQKGFRPGSPYLLTGLIWCAECGERYVSKKYDQVQTNKNGKQREYHRLCYGCSNRVKRDKNYNKHEHKCENIIISQSELDAIVVDFIKRIKITGFDCVVEDNGLSVVMEKINELNIKREKNIDLYTDGLISKESLKIRLDEIDKKIEMNEKFLQEKKSNVAEAPSIDVNQINEKLDKWDELELYEKRTLLKLIVDKIVINKEKIDINLKARYCVK